MDMRSTLRIAFAGFALAAAAACSGNGMTSTPNGASSGYMPAAKVAPGHGHATLDHQRNLAGSGLAAIGAGLQIKRYASPKGFLVWVMRHGNELSHTLRPHVPAPTPAPTAPPCQYGVEQRWSSSGPGQISASIEYFYDFHCTRPFQLSTLNANFPGTNQSGTGVGTLEFWNPQGSVVSYATNVVVYTALQVKNGTNPSVLSVLNTIATAPGAVPYASDGVSCGYGLGTDVDCATGVVETVGYSPAQMLGFAQSFSGDFANDATPTPSPTATPIVKVPPTIAYDPAWSNGENKLQLAIQGSGFSGAPGSLQLGQPSSSVPWTIDGGQQVSSLNGNASFGFGWNGSWGNGGLENVNLTLNDLSNGLVATFTSTQWGGIAGNVTQNGQKVATIAVDLAGFGTINYTNGQRGQVRDWIIQD
jgi:hypothetical protein